jgi:hypothetical protein
MKPEVDDKAFECVLPDGRFATMRRIKLLDMLCAWASGNSALAVLAARVVKLDGIEYTAAEWCEFDYLDIAPILIELNRRLVSANDSRGVA